LVFYGIGAYAFSVLLVRGAPLPACFVAASVVSAVAAALLAFPLFRLHGDYFAFGTLALLPLAELLAFQPDAPDRRRRRDRPAAKIRALSRLLLRD
jgi:ABC-type branched-subunit amino acid transport system permease subunit